MDKQKWGIKLYTNGMSQEEANALNDKIREILYEQNVPEWSMTTGCRVRIPKSLHDKDHKPEES